MALVALVLAVAGAFAALSLSKDGPAGPRPAADAPETIATKAAAPEPSTEPEPAGRPPAGATVLDATSSAVESPRTVASSVSISPVTVAPAPAPAPASDAARLAAQANEAYGVEIVVQGQDWGADGAAQTANLQAVISAIDRLPDTVISAVVAHAHGPLTFVSNDEGRTLDGWQPYGGHAMTYYTNSDQGPEGRRPANQVVASVGATSMSIGHELLHAFQFRNVGADQYVLALLQPEMRSFMEATGWRQTGSDDDVRRALNQPWSALDALYVYEGRPLTYATTSGGAGALTADNPVEAFAIAGSVYYTRPSWMTLPDWPEYWAWFQANVG